MAAAALCPFHISETWSLMMAVSCSRHMQLWWLNSVLCRRKVSLLRINTTRKILKESKILHLSCITEPFQISQRAAQRNHHQHSSSNLNSRVLHWSSSPTALLWRLLYKTRSVTLHKTLNVSIRIWESPNTSVSARVRRRLRARWCS